MDTLSLIKYSRQSLPPDTSSTSLKQLSKSKRRTSSNTTLTHKGLVKSGSPFLEFFINDHPLSRLLDKFYQTKGSILDNWIGVLGSSENYQSEIIKVKQLLGKRVSDKEIRLLYPSEWSDRECQWYIEKEREALSDPEVIIYGCAECGDYDCGGIKAKIEKTSEAFKWIIAEKEEQLIFEFNRYQYFDLFDKYIRELERMINCMYL